MHRAAGIAVLGLFLSLMLAPLAILLEFHVHRASIERELCVQRDVMDSMRTCHGECQLAKRFKALEQESGMDFPVDRIQVRLEPLVPVSDNEALMHRDVSNRVFPDHEDDLLNIVASVPDQVPRA